MLKNKKILITAGPTYEAIDPVRFIGNRSSGKQGYAIAKALNAAGAHVTLISGPTALPDPGGIKIIRIESAQEMLEACQKALPADIGIFTAAVADWAPAQTQDHKIKKRGDESPPTITLKENPDILRTITNHNNRPKLVIGFAAETENLIKHAQDKLSRKGCDIIIANDVSNGKTFGSDQNHAYFITSNQTQDWGLIPKTKLAEKLVKEIKKWVT